MILDQRRDINADLRAVRDSLDAIDLLRRQTKSDQKGASPNGNSVVESNKPDGPLERAHRETEEDRQAGGQTKGDQKGALPNGNPVVGSSVPDGPLKRPCRETEDHRQAEEVASSDDRHVSKK